MSEVPEMDELELDQAYNRASVYIRDAAERGVQRHLDALRLYGVPACECEDPELWATARRVLAQAIDQVSRLADDLAEVDRAFLEAEALGGGH